LEFLGIHFNLKTKPVLDEGFIPFSKWSEAYLKEAKAPFSIAVHRPGDLVSVYDTKVYATPERMAADLFYIERVVKFLLWARGGFQVDLYGSAEIGQKVAAIYSKSGARVFDFDFMSKIYERPFTIKVLPYEERIAPKEKSKPVGRHLNGCRIGFDAGGSDRKVSAVIDGKAVFSEETVWYPKINENPDYHYDGIVESFKKAASHMPRVDGIGVSSAGVFIDNRTMAASLFLKIPPELFETRIKDIYIRAAKEIGENIPVEVANDGDVTALAGAMDLDDSEVLGIAMGTSQAGGYVDRDGNITGWLNELAFVPVDAQTDAMVDEWSGDRGCGVKYFSQDAVNKLAPRAGIGLDMTLPPAKNLKIVQDLMEAGDARAAKVFESIGAYLGYAIPLYTSFYPIRHVLLLGRVMSGEGGNLIFNTAKRILREEYEELDARITLHLPDESSRRVGQSIAAASLPAIG
jgi:predicted NBD/HSP70 family sugar kinase